MQVPLLDLKAQYSSYKDAALKEIKEVCDDQYFINGPKVVGFEKMVEEYCGTGHALGVSSGSDALIIALMVEGIGEGDEVIMPPFTFFATAGAVSRVGAKPVFVDVEEGSFNLDPIKVKAAINENTADIIPVHLYGQMADMDPIMEIAEEHSLIVIEDGAQAIGSEYKGRKSGTIGHYGTFSFFPSKNLGGFGDGGMVMTDTEERLEKLQYFRNHGSNPKYYHKFIGGNFRLDALQAAVLSTKLPLLNDWHDARKENADLYRQLFADSSVADKVKLPEVQTYTTRHIYNQFCIRIADGRRDELKEALIAAGVGCDVYYPLCLHEQECFSELGYKHGDFPVAELLASDIMAIPIFPELTREQQEYVVATIEKALS